MPSPFPGMDPFLENAEFFGGVHHALIGYLCEALQPILPEPYYADIRSREWIEMPPCIIVPDVDVGGPCVPSRSVAVGAVAVLLSPMEISAVEEERSESYLTIHTDQGDKPLVTTIEVLSLTSKMTGAVGRIVYLKQQGKMLSSRVNLVEIDLLRGGHHSTAVRYQDAVAAAGPFDYHVCVHRIDDPHRLHITPILLKQRLPEIHIPLRPGDADVKIDLQAVFDRCYDTGPYRRGLPYRHTPEPSLSPEQGAWAEAILRDKGLLSAP